MFPCEKDTICSPIITNNVKNYKLDLCDIRTKSLSELMARPVECWNRSCVVWTSLIEALMYTHFQLLYLVLYHFALLFYLEVLITDK